MLSNINIVMHQYQKSPGIISFTSLLVILSLSIGCNKSNNKDNPLPSEIANQGFDTLQKIRIDSMVNQINFRSKQQPHPSMLAFPVFHPNDSLKYWSSNDEPERIILYMSTGETIIWPAFYVLHGKLIFIRFRASHGDETKPYVEEKMIYLKDGEIVYCEERKKDLNKGESPGSLSHNSYVKSTEPIEDIEKFYLPYWTPVKEAISKKTGMTIK